MKSVAIYPNFAWSKLSYFLVWRATGPAIQTDEIFFSIPTPEEKKSPAKWADKKQGDGGVDVTGAPKSKSVEGADFGLLLCFSSWKRSFSDLLFLEVLANNSYSWGLQLLSRRVLGFSKIPG